MRTTVSLISGLLAIAVGCTSSTPAARLAVGSADDREWEERSASQWQHDVLHPSRPAAASPTRFAADLQIEPDQLQEGNAAAPEARASDRRLVYQADLSLTVVEIEKAIDSAVQTARGLGGYVQHRGDRTLTVRIPAERFDDAVKEFEGLGVVDRRNVQAQDVTDEFVDLEARIRAAEAVRDRLLTLLERAEDVKAALEVEKELGRVNGELERLKAQLDGLKKRVAYSTVSLTFATVSRTPTELNPMLRLPFDWLDELDLGRLVGQRGLSPTGGSMSGAVTALSAPRR